MIISRLPSICVFIKHTIKVNEKYPLTRIQGYSNIFCIFHVVTIVSYLIWFLSSKSAAANLLWHWTPYASFHIIFCTYGYVNMVLCVGFQVVTAASMKISVFWVVALCSQVEIYQSFRGTCCLHHQGDESSPWWWRQDLACDNRVSKFAVDLIDCIESKYKVEFTNRRGTKESWHSPAGAVKESSPLIAEPCLTPYKISLFR
jgi:hypothetical protein